MLNQYQYGFCINILNVSFKIPNWNTDLSAIILHYIKVALNILAPRIIFTSYMFSRALSHIDTDSIRKFNLFFQLWQLDPLWQTCRSSASGSIWKGGSQEPKFDLDLTRSDGSATSPNWSDRWFSGTDASAYWKHLHNTKWRTTLEQVNKA